MFVVDNVERIFTIFVVFLFGSIFGSFINVLIYRLPLNMDVVFKGSFCPKCKNPIKWYHNIPIFSYLFLKGRCAYCGEKIDISYLLVEIFTAISFVIFYLIFGISFEFFVLCSFFVISLPIVIIDLKYYIIPDELNLSIFILGLFVAFFNVFFRGDFLDISILSLHLDSLSITSNFFDSFMGVFVGFLIFGGIYYSSLIIFKKEGMGWGDVKLSMSLGAFLGSSPSIIAFLLSFLLGSVFGIFITALKRLKNYKKIKVIYLLKDLSVSSDVFTSLVRSYLYDIELDQLKTNYIAFGPYMILGAWISIFLAKFIADFFVGEII